MLNLTGKTAAVLGAGRSGRAAARLAKHCGATVTIYDSREAEETVLANPEMGLEVNADLVVVSPGIETNGEFVQSFAKGSGALWGEIELAWRCYTGRQLELLEPMGKRPRLNWFGIWWRQLEKVVWLAGITGSLFLRSFFMILLPMSFLLN